MAAKHIMKCLLVRLCSSILKISLRYRHQEMTFLVASAPFCISAVTQSPIISLNHLCAGEGMQL